MIRKSLIVGSRGSRLALTQTEQVMQPLKQSYPHLEFRIRTIKTMGDQKSKTPLAQIGGQGIFVKELEMALLSGEIDMAVHSMKDVPTEIDPAFKIAAVGMRIDVRDALVSRSGKPLSELPKGARIGTGSPRRAAQLRAFRHDLQICPLRGNLDTRLRKLYSEELDGISVAAAAMIRMGWKDKITEFLPVELVLPAVGQGALTVEIKAQDEELAELLRVVNDESTSQSVQAERAFLSALGGGCRTPIAALGTVTDSTLHLRGMIASPDGRILRAEGKGSPSEPEGVGRALAQRFLAMGALELIQK